MRQLSGSQLKKLMETIIQEYKLAEFDEVIEAYGKDRERIIIGKNYDDIAFNVLMYLESKLELDRFLIFMQTQDPDNENLRSILDELGIENQ